MVLAQYHIYAVIYDDYEGGNSHELASWHIDDLPLDEEPVFSIEEIVGTAADFGYPIGEWKLIDIIQKNDNENGPLLAYLLYQARMDDPYSEEGGYWNEQGIRAFSNTFYLKNAWRD